MSVRPRFEPNRAARHRRARIGMVVFQLATLVGIVVLMALLYNIINNAFGLAAIEYRIYPATLGLDLETLPQTPRERLLEILETHLSPGLRRSLERTRPLTQRSNEELATLVLERVLQPKVLDTWPLVPSLLHTQDIVAEVHARFPQAEVRWVRWLNTRFLTRPQSSDPLRAGVRTAILGSLWLVAITAATALPLGVAAAIYLEEYARKDRWYNRLIQVNINNLAGVPSIIYGILGLAIFVRALEPLTSGAVFGAVAEGVTANGRTVLSGGLTLGLLVLPIVIINAQEALRAVPNSLREAAYALGATKWQVVWHHVLPEALPGIMTGTILALSRALGETAPLVVVGASTFITFDPVHPFSKFTALPIQIYQWTARPQPVFRNLAAAASLTLLLLLFLSNGIAVYIRYRARQRRMV